MHKRGRARVQINLAEQHPVFGGHVQVIHKDQAPLSKGWTIASLLPARVRRKSEYRPHGPGPSQPLVELAIDDVLPSAAWLKEKAESVSRTCGLWAAQVRRYFGTRFLKRRALSHGSSVPASVPAAFRQPGSSSSKSGPESDWRWTAR